MWNGLSCQIQIKICKAVVLPSLLYSYETLTLCTTHTRTMNRFQLNCMPLDNTNRVVRQEIRDGSSQTCQSGDHWDPLCQELDGPDRACSVLERHWPSKTALWGSDHRKAYHGRSNCILKTLLNQAKNFDINPDTLLDVALDRTAYSCTVQ